MSEQNVKINLLFQANTNAAINNIKQLNQLLGQISNNTTIGFDGGSLDRASASARQLQIHLQNAVNVDTGKLDLTKLSLDLKKSGQTLQQLTANIQAVGPVGQQAFIKLANAVAQAETPMVKLGSRTKDFITTLANTAKWQIASTAMHGLQGIMQSAVGHAEDLNKALNDIRIVTGYSEQAMAKFAKSASVSAKELSTTTTEYSKAALIFYQQGLNGSEVTERADTVIKLSQVTGQSAQQVSDQMTAIWNNFDDGSQSLEYYADVLAKLGAATAADTQEITDGLSKFAAVADTVGLSYETAAAAVATVVDKTKQSADVVGTSFKTIFARMQGLKLGETLEDGVDLNKYSEALSKVGIQVLDAKGEMRDMDDILSELGEKWDGFGETTQTAIAQTVGGIRQYNQMISLMDNWDSVKNNIDMAKEATGELADQQSIWADSYEASAERVKQAQNELYESFISSDTLITFNNLSTELLGGITKAIENFGGIIPVITTIIGLFSKQLFPIALMGFRKLGNVISVWSGKAAKDVAAMQGSVMQDMSNMLSKSGFSEGMIQQIQLTKELLSVKREITLASQRMTEAQKEEMQSHLDSYEILVAETQQLLAKKVATEESLKLSKDTLNSNSTYKKKSAMASQSTFTAFSQDSQSKGYSQDYIDDIIDQASNTTYTDTEKDIDSLKQKKLDLQNDRFQKEKQLKSAKQTAADEKLVLDQKIVENTSSGLDTPDATRRMEKWVEATDKAKELETELQNTSKSYQAQLDAIDLQIQKLEEVKKLQKEIHSTAIKTEASDISAGKTSLTRFSDSDDIPVANMEKSMMSKSVSNLNGKMTMGEGSEIGTISVDASISNLELLYAEMGKYKIQLAETAAFETDFKNAQVEVEQVFSEFKTVVAEGSEEQKNFIAAQKELSSIGEEVSSSAEKVAIAENKLNQELNKEKKDSKAIKAARKELIKASKDSTQAQLKYQKVLDKQPDIFKKMIKAQKPILDSKKQFLEMAKNAGASTDEIKELSQAFDEFKKTGDPSKLKQVSTTLQNIQSAATNTIGGLDSLSGEMRELLISAGMSDEQIDPIIQKLRELANTAPEVQNKLTGVKNKFDGIKGGLDSTSHSVENAIQGLATFVGQMSMAYAGAQTLAGVFDSSASPMERFTSLLTGMSMILPVIAMMTKMVANAKKEDTLASIQQTIQEAKAVGAKGIHAAATWAQVAAEVALKIAQNPAVGAVVLGLVLAAGVAMAVYTQKTEAATEATKKQNQAQAETGEKVKEAANEWREQTAIMDDVIVRHEKLQAAGKNTNEVLQDLITTANDLADAYLKAGEALKLIGTDITIDGQAVKYEEAIKRMQEAAKAGDTEMVEKYQNALDNVVNQSGAQSAKDTAKAAMSDVALAMADEGGAEYKDGKVSRHVGGVGKEEETAVAILSSTSLGSAEEGANGIDLSLDTADSGAFLDQYEELQAAADKIKNELGDKADNSDVLREINEMLGASEEEYNALKEAQAEAEKYSVFDAKEKLETSEQFVDESGNKTGETMDIKNIDSLDEYEQYKEKLLANTSQDPAAQQAAEDWLAAQTHLQDYVEASSKIDYVTAAEKGGAWAGKQEELQGIFDELSEEQKKLFLEVDFDEATTKTEVLEEIEKAQRAADKAERVTLAEEVGVDTDEFEAYVQLLMQENKALEANYQSAEDFKDAITEVALANKRMEKGVKKIADDWEDFDSVMSDSTSTAEDISSILPDVNEGLQDILNISDEEFELLPPDFAQKNWKLIQDVMNGVDGAVDTLRDKAGQEILLNVTGAVDADGKMKAEIQAIHDSILEMDNAEDFTVGIAIDPEKHAEFITNCNSLIAAAEMTAEEAKAYFASMGYDVELKEVKPESKDTSTYSYYELDEAATEKAGGVPQFKKTPTEIAVTSTSGATAYAIETITPNGSYGGGVGVNTTAPKSATKGKNKGGGSKKEPKKTSEARGKKEDIVDRYKETNDELEKTSRLMKKNETLTSKLWGPAKIAQMKNNIKLMEKENQQLEKKYELSKKYLAEDKQGLQKAASDAGVSFTFDESGAIVNYTEEMTKLFQQREALLDSFGATMDENEEKRLEEFDKKVEALKDAYETYETTLDEKQDMEQEHLEKMLAIQEEYFNVLNEELEIKISIDETSLKVLDYYLGKMEDDFFSRAESAALMVGGTVNGQTTLMSDSQLGKYQSQLQSNEDYLAQLEYDHTTINPETGETYINDAQYMEGLETAMDGMIENLNAIQQLDKAMMHYYGDTLAAAGEEIDKVTSRMEHQTEVLDHYMTMLDLMNKSNDYKAIGTVLEGKAKTTKNEMIAAREEYDMYRKEAEEKYKLWMSATNEEEAELYKKQYEDALAASDEAQSEYLSKAETYAEQLKAILENSLNEYAQSLENALTGGTSFDQLTAKMERAASLQEEYLTTTNKIYETNKLMNQAQQEIDKSTNSVAQRRLKQFISETNQLQQKNKLSQYELEIQQAKYDLLLAEIALEEAQEAKSTVRLQRDSEGNFGYVYTADSSKIAEAEQKLSDAQNSLYNIALEGANGYTEKYQQTLQEMYETLTDLQQQYLSGAFESEEEYHAAVEAAKVYYYEKLEQYSDLHSIAIAADTRVIEDAWSSQFSSMIYNTREWKEKVDLYVDNAADAFRRWNIEMDDLAGDLGLGGDLSNLSTAVGEVTSESDKLLDTLTKPGGVLDSIQAEFDAVTAVTTAYAKEREEISKTVAEYEKLIKAIDTKKQAEGKAEEDKKTDKNQQKSEEKKENSSNPDGSSPKLTYGSHVSVKPGTKWYYDSYGTSPTGTARAGTIKYINLNGSHPYNIEGLGWIKKTDIVGYDTGGYTGTWGSYGKLAMLHEKELILNPGDTTNFLASIELLDNIIKTIDLQAANSQLGGLLKSPSFGNLMQQQQALEQNVKIEASFPNVQNRTEIEAAFETLVNRASQYANRK